jgi:hypothetical protein
MATLLGGSRWDDETTPLDDDWYFYKTEKERKENPLNDDYVPEKYRVDCDEAACKAYDGGICLRLAD